MYLVWVNNLLPAIPHYVAVPPVATLTDGGGWTPITAIQTTCLPPGLYTLYLGFLTGGAAYSINVQGTLSYEVVKKY